MHRSFRSHMCGKDREVSGDVLVSIRALHQPSQAQHLTLLAQAADEGDEPAHDRRLSCQPLPAHESGVSHRTLPPALPRGLRGSGGVIESHRGTRGGKTDRQFVFTKHLFFASHATPSRDMYFILHRQLCLDMFWVVGLHIYSHLPFRFLPQMDKNLACINLPLVPTYLPTSEGAYFKSVTKIPTHSKAIS